MRLLSRCEPINGCGKTYPADLDKCPHCGTPEAFSVAAPLNPRDWGWDEETYPNCYTCTFTHASTGLEVVFEISDRRNQAPELIEFALGLGRSGARGIGFNNLGFDYPILHWIIANPDCTVAGIYAKAMTLIKSDDKFGSMVWADDRVFEQIDLFKICHFDNMAKSTSLKALEIVMRSRNVIDLPFPVGTVLTDPQKDVLIGYNKHDVRETLKFYVRNLEQIQFREQLTAKYQRDFMNHNDTKIGKDYFIMELEKAGVECFVRGPGGKQPRQTVRPSIRLADVIFPYVKFERQEFQRILDFFNSTTITQTKGTFADLTTTVDGLEYKFGTGGIHAAANWSTFVEDEEFIIELRDVTSYYPSMAIKNRLFPEHLSEKFCDIYEDMFNQRRSFDKKSNESKMLKLALNGTYGDSNNVYSPFYDPKFTMAITVNGQLMLCMLVEQLIKTPHLRMININTDGVGFVYPRKYKSHVDSVCQWWQDVTMLNLETEEYSKFFQRDCNNYIGVACGDASPKRKGAYEYNTLWHQDPSAQVVARAAEAALVRGESVREFITNHRDPFDFMCRAKVPRSNSLHLRFKDWGIDQQLQGTTRYFVSRNGGSLVKVAPPTGEPGTWKRKAKLTDSNFNAVMREITGQPGDLDSAGTPWDTRIHTGNRSKHDTRETGICSGWRVTECADARHFDWSDLNYEWYIQEAEKLVNPLIGGA